MEFADGFEANLRLYRSIIEMQAIRGFRVSSKNFADRRSVWKRSERSETLTPRSTTVRIVGDPSTDIDATVGK